MIKKQQYTKKAETLGTYYANMDAAAAAVRLSEMSEDLDLVCDILQNMQEKKAAAILEQCVCRTDHQKDFGSELVVLGVIR